MSIPRRRGAHVFASWPRRAGGAPQHARAVARKSALHSIQEAIARPVIRPREWRRSLGRASFQHFPTGGVSEARTEDRPSVGAHPGSVEWLR